jgi:hypothetical protein
MLLNQALAAILDAGSGKRSAGKRLGLSAYIRLLFGQHAACMLVGGKPTANGEQPRAESSYRFRVCYCRFFSGQRSISRRNDPTHAATDVSTRSSAFSPRRGQRRARPANPRPRLCVDVRCRAQHRAGHTGNHLRQRISRCGRDWAVGPNPSAAALPLAPRIAGRRLG